MLVNRATILLVAIIFLMVTIYGPVSARELTVINNSDANLLQNQSVDSQLSDTETRAITNDSSQNNPAIYGDRIVWQNLRSEDSNGDIYLYNINNSTENRITASGLAYSPDIYDDRIVWVDRLSKDSDIYMYNLSTHVETKITTNKSDQKNPAIYGDRIVWADDRNRNGSNVRSDIYMYDLSTNKETRITTDISATSPDIYRDRIVWAGFRNDKMDIYMYNISTSKETQITKSGSVSNDSLSIYGDRIVWINSRNEDEDIYMYDLSTKNETLISTSESAQSPDIHGDRIVWEDWRNGNADIYMYNLSTSKGTQITKSGSAHDPAIYGDTVVWTDFLNISDIYIYDISTSKEIPINTSKLSPTIIGRNGTGIIYVYTSLSWNPDSAAHLEKPKFTILGPDRKYVGNGSYWAKSDAPKGKYTISYEPVSGYDTPVSETKILKEGDSIKFSGNYLLKKRVGESLDFGDGYVLFIKQMDPEKKEAILELQLDKRKVDEVRVKEHETVNFNKISFSGNKSDEPSPSEIILENVSRDVGGGYIDLSFDLDRVTEANVTAGPSPEVVVTEANVTELEANVTGPIPTALLIIDSIPEGANISFDGTYIGKTSREIPIVDLKTYSIHLELKGYESWDKQIKFDELEQQKIEANLTKRS